MPTFGQYETAQRLHLTGVGALYALQGDTGKVIKVLQPPEGIWSDEQLHDEIDGFLKRTKLQRTVAQASPNWAPVHAAAAIRAGSETSSGGGEGFSLAGLPETRASGAYCVLDRYDRSAQSLVDGRVNLHNADLRNVMSGVIRGLIDIRKIANRPHGNLKHSNILLAKATDLAAAVVHLADPAPEGAIKADTHNKDLGDLGRIIYELVNLRPYQGGTIGRSKDWDDLGPNGEDWRKLCTALLDPGAPAEQRDLERILAQVQTWTAKPKKSKTPLLVAGLVLLLLVGGGITLYFGTRPPKLDFSPADWEKLCLSYYSWFGTEPRGQTGFIDHFDEATLKKFSADPYPTKIQELIRAAGSDLDKYRPVKLAGKPQSAKELAINPTEDAKKGYAPYYTQKGVEFIEKVTASLTPDSWPVLKQLDTTASGYEQRGWKRPAAGIRELMKEARPPVLPLTPVDIEGRAKLVEQVDVFKGIEETIAASGTVAQIDARWGRIQEQLKKLPSTNVPLLGALPKFAEDLPRSEVDPTRKPTLADVQELAVAFDEIDKLVNQLVADLTGPERQIVFEELAKDPGVQLPADGKMTVAMFSAIPQVARGYAKIADDPRGATDWAKALDSVQKEYINNIPASANDPNLPVLVRRRETLQQQVAAWASIVPIEKNRKEIETKVSKAREDLASLTGDGQKWVAPYLKKASEVLAEQQGRLNTSPLNTATPAVKAEWQKAHNALLAKLRTDAQGVTILEWTKYKMYEGKFNKLEQTYTDFDRKIEPKIVGLSDLPGSDWRHAIGTRVATVYREEALKEIMTNPALKWQDDLPQVDDPAYLSYQKQRLDGYRQTCTDATSLIADYSGINDRLDRLLLRNEDSAPAPSWRDLNGKWQPGRNVLMGDAQILTALKPISDRMAAIIKLDGATDYKALLTETGSSAPEISLTAWRLLGNAAVSADLPALDDEDKAEASLTAHLNGLSRTTPPRLDGPRLTAFNNEIRAQRPLRWHRWADQLTSAAAIQTALDRRESFGVTLNRQTDAAFTYDEALYALRKEFEKSPQPPEDQLKPIARNFITNVRSMPAAVSQEKSIVDLLKRMETSLSQTAAESSAAGAGPQLAGWEQEKPREGVRIFYYPNKAAARRSLEFIQLAVNNKTIFLCTTEMSFGLFAETVNASGRFADLNNVGKPANKQHWFTASEDPWDGPRIWRITSNSFVPNPLWLFKVPQMGETPYYPADATPPLPGADLPMQGLSPWSAMFAARLLGCRLPTSDEWKAAYDKFEAAGPKDAWNLRGAAWLTQFNYAKPLSGKGMKFPDDGIFLTVDKLFAGITAESAKPWTGDGLSKIAPARFTPGADPYKGSTLWFRRVGAQPGANPMHDLVGNVAEYVFDGSADKPANGVVKDIKASLTEIDAAITPLDSRDRSPKNAFVIGGSALSPPQVSFLEKLPVDPTFAQTNGGFSDVGFRLAYTAPIDSIIDVLASTFKEPPYLPGPKSKP